MRWLNILKLRIRSIFFRRAVERDLRDELAFHASHAPLRGEEQIKEECRDARGVGFLEHLARDVRFALRLFRRNVGFTTLAVTTLALGIGSATAIFGVVDGVLLRPLPYPEPDRLVRFWEGRLGQAPIRNVVNPWNFLDWQTRARSFDSMAAMTTLNLDLTGDGEPVSTKSMQVSRDFFTTVGVKPIAGRWFTPEEFKQGASDFAIISYGLWQSRYGGAPMVGKTIRMGRTPTIVVGVMPPGFTFVTQQIDLWVPMPLVRSADSEGGRYLTTVARLKAGVSVEQAAREMQGVGAQLAKDRPDFDTGWTVETVSVLDGLTEGVRRPLLIMLGAVGCLLLIACANVANLLLMRGAERTREIAVRASLGAGRAHILRQLVTESLIMAAFAGIAGLTLARAALLAVQALLAKTTFLPRLNAVHIDTRVLAFTIVVSAATSVLFGLFPAARLARLELNDALKRGSRGVAAGHRRFRYVFVTAQVALALMLLAGAGLLGRSFMRLIEVNPGFNPHQLLTMYFLTTPADYSQPAKRADYVGRVVREAASVPGVDAAAIVHFRPLEDLVSGSCYNKIDQPDPVRDSAHAPSADMLVTTPGYPRAMGIPLISGRDFNTEDRIGNPSVVMVSRTFAAQVFPGQDAVGQQLNVCWSVKNPVQIIGVIGDLRQSSLEKSPRGTVFIPALQSPSYINSLLVRTAGDPATMAASVKEAIHRVNPNQAVYSIHTMDEVFQVNVAQPRFQYALLAVFAAIAMTLAGIGVYGVVAYSVTQRTREIGIRFALGASRMNVANMVVSEGALLAGAGLLLGLAGAIAFSGVMRDLLYEIPPSDPATLAGVSCALGAIALIAAVIPARRAARIAPVVALREE